VAQIIIASLRVRAMGSQVSTIKAAAGRFAAETKKKGLTYNKAEKAKIGILAFEVANVMSKSISLWQSLSDHEILRLRTEVIKAEGVLNLVSDNESILLTLACMEKLQDLAALASAVARLGQRCQESTLQGFEHVYNDILQQSIDARALGFPVKEMDKKMKKMEQYIVSTANLYQELEALANLEQAVHRLQQEESEEEIATDSSETVSAMEQKALWQRQEIKYVRDLSLWNCTYDKIVSLLARTVCTIHARIVSVFGSPMLGLSHVFPHQQNGTTSSQNFPAFRPNSSLTSSSQPASFNSQLSHQKGTSEAFVRHSSCRVDSVSQSISPLGSSACAKDGGPSLVGSSLTSQTTTAPHGDCEDRPSPSPNLSSGPHLTQRRHSFVCYSPSVQNASCSPSSAGPLISENTTVQFFERPPTSNLVQAETTDLFTSGLPNANSHSIQPGQSQRDSAVLLNGCNVRLLFDPKSRHRMVPWSTLGGAALALHYANVVIILEKMIRYPHLIDQEIRDDLYGMLPRSVRLALRSRLRASSRLCDNNKTFDPRIAANWRETLDRLLIWLAPLAHNMIRWQSEHNFEQQQVVARTNILLLQTLYFADVVKTESAITELLVGLNYIAGLEQEMKSNSTMMEQDLHKQQEDSEEYLGWPF